MEVHLVNSSWIASICVYYMDAAKVLLLDSGSGAT